MAIGINWGEIWADVWGDVWEQAEVAAPQQTIAPALGPFKIRDKRAKEFQKVLDEGVRRHQAVEDEKARAIGKAKEEADAFIRAEKARQLEAARKRREIEVLKGLKAGKAPSYPKANLAGAVAFRQPTLKASLSGEHTASGPVRLPSTSVRASLSGEHAMQGSLIQAPILTGRAAREMEDDAIALALGMPELAEVLGEFVRI